MQRAQIQLPEPLYAQVKSIAHARDWSVAELIRRATEAYIQTCAQSATNSSWEMPVLRGSGGHKVDPATIGLEANIISSRFDTSDS